jgi:hypothetical protein
MIHRKASRKVGPKNKEFPNGKHKSLIQKTTHSFSSTDLIEPAELAKKLENLTDDKSWNAQQLLEQSRHLAQTYLENSPHDHTKCKNWKWGFMTSKESKTAADLDGGFEAAFHMLFTIYCIEKDIKKGDTDKVIVHSLRLVNFSIMLVTAKLEPLYHAGVVKTKAANNVKIQALAEHKAKAWPTYQRHISNRKSKTSAAKLTSKFLKDEYNIERAPDTIRRWF